MWLLGRYFPLLRFDYQALTLTGILLIGGGLLLDVAALLQFRKARTTINPLRPENSSTIVTSGVYRVSRNPMYLGMLTVLTGIALLLKALAGFFLLPVFVLLINRLQIIPEEHTLLRLFGAPYDAYLKSVRCWI